MARGKYRSLEEARKSGKLERFAKEHQSESEGDQFRLLLDAMAKGSREGEQTSDRGASEGYSGTRTPRDTSEDTSD